MHISEIANQAAVTSHLAADPFARHLGIDIIDVEPGTARVTLRLQDWMCNAHGMPHGGLLFSLADTAFALASNAYGVIAVALDVSITFCRPAAIGALLTGTAAEINRTTRTGLYELNVHDDAGRLIATARGTVFRTDRPVLNDANEGKTETVSNENPQT